MTWSTENKSVWPCPLDHSDVAEGDHCLECGAVTGRPGVYHTTGFWHSLHPDLRWRLRCDTDQESIVNSMMSASKGVIEKVAEICEGDNVRGAHCITSSIYTLHCRLKHLVAIAKLREVSYLEGGGQYRISEAINKVAE